MSASFSGSDSAVKRVGISFSSALGVPPSLDRDEKSIYVAINGGIPEVVLSGKWDGRMLSGAIKAIEKQYKMRKLTAKRESLAR